jgi:hypothetical protein
MKRYSYHIRNAVILMIACLLFVSGSTVSQAMSADAQSRRDVLPSTFTRRGNDPARLIIYRVPNLGNNIIVDLRVDGAPFASIAYGHTFKGFLPPGRHVLSVRATPRARWLTPWQMTLDARSGHVYSFTAMGDSSGNLILKEK